LSSSLSDAPRRYGLLWVFDVLLAAGDSATPGRMNIRHDLYFPFSHGCLSRFLLPVSFPLPSCLRTPRGAPFLLSFLPSREETAFSCAAFPGSYSVASFCSLLYFLLLYREKRSGRFPPFSLQFRREAFRSLPVFRAVSRLRGRFLEDLLYLRRGRGGGDIGGQYYLFLAR